MEMIPGSGEERARKRFAFKSPEHDAKKKFPVVMKELRRYDPAYDIVWDRQKERWLVVTWVTRENWRGTKPPRPIFFLEDEYGCREEPDNRLIDRLHQTDWRTHASTIEGFLDKLEQWEKIHAEKREAYIEQEDDLWTSDWIDYLERNPETIGMTGIASTQHLVGLARQLETDMCPPTPTEAP
jgi:hypothetical protein